MPARKGTGKQEQSSIRFPSSVFVDDPPAVRRLPATKGVFQFAEETVRAQRTARLRILAESRLEFQVDHTVIFHNEDILAVVSALGDVVRLSRNHNSGKSGMRQWSKKGLTPAKRGTSADGSVPFLAGTII